MKLREIYELAIKMGIERDVRGSAEIDRILAKNRQEFERLENASSYFDKRP